MVCLFVWLAYVCMCASVNLMEYLWVQGVKMDRGEEKVCVVNVCVYVCMCVCGNKSHDVSLPLQLLCYGYSVIT